MLSFLHSRDKTIMLYTIILSLFFTMTMEENMNYTDLHCDTITKARESGQNLFENNLAVDFKRLEKLSAAQVFAIFINNKFKKSEALNEYNLQLSFFNTQKNLYNPDCKCILSLENASPINTNINNIYKFIDDGIKIMSLCHNGENEIVSESGLTKFGRELVLEMNKTDIILDASHLNDNGFFDLEKIYNGRIIATHSNARTVFNHKRNLLDEQIKTITARGGMIGINFYPLFINGKKSLVFSDIARHIEHILNLDGENAVCFGSDFDGADMSENLKTLDDVPDLCYYITDKFGKGIADRISHRNANIFLERCI